MRSNTKSLSLRQQPAAAGGNPAAATWWCMSTSITATKSLCSWWIAQDLQELCSSKCVDVHAMVLCWFGDKRPHLSGRRAFSRGCMPSRARHAADFRKKQRGNTRRGGMVLRTSQFCFGLSEREVLFTRTCENLCRDGANSALASMGSFSGDGFWSLEIRLEIVFLKHQKMLPLQSYHKSMTSQIDSRVMPPLRLDFLFRTLSSKVHLSIYLSIYLAS